VLGGARLGQGGGRGVVEGSTRDAVQHLAGLGQAASTDLAGGLAEGPLGGGVIDEVELNGHVDQYEGDH